MFLSNRHPLGTTIPSLTYLDTPPHTHTRAHCMPIQLSHQSRWARAHAVDPKQPVRATCHKELSSWRGREGGRKEGGRRDGRHESRLEGI